MFWQNRAADYWRLKMGMIACECPLGICDGSGLIPVKGGNNFCDCHQSDYEATPHYTECRVGDFDYAVSFSYRRYEAWLGGEYLPPVEEKPKQEYPGYESNRVSAFENKPIEKPEPSKDRYLQLKGEVKYLQKKLQEHLTFKKRARGEY